MRQKDFESTDVYFVNSILSLSLSLCETLIIYLGETHWPKSRKVMKLRCSPSPVFLTKKNETANISSLKKSKNRAPLQTQLLSAEGQETSLSKFHMKMFWSTCLLTPAARKPNHKLTPGSTFKTSSIPALDETEAFSFPLRGLKMTLGLEIR